MLILRILKRSFDRRFLSLYAFYISLILISYAFSFRADSESVGSFSIIASKLAAVYVPIAMVVNVLVLACLLEFFSNEDDKK